MTVTYNGEANTIKSSHRKENHYTGSSLILCVEGGEIKHIGELRYYHTDSRAYACLWIHDGMSNTYTGGSGYAGGYGYHRASAAASNAIRAAGYTMDQPIDGRGDEAVRDALVSIGALHHPNSVIRIIDTHA